MDSSTTTIRPTAIISTNVPAIYTASVPIRSRCVALYVAGNAGCACPRDINSDGVRDITDLAQLLAVFGSQNEDCADINADGIVDLADLAQLLSTFGAPY
jgi:hypothetical protein